MTTYSVNDIYPTIQGEGVLTGVPMVLVRLHGCAVGCSFCDTKETWYFNENLRQQTIDDALGTSPKYATVDAQVIADYIEQRYPHLEWILLTGGEPADYDLTDLVSCLHAYKKKVAIETSGTALGHVNAKIDHVCVSPKISMPGGRVVLRDAVYGADEVKFVIGKKSDIQKFNQFRLDYPFKLKTVFSLQPMSMGKKATELCIQTALEQNLRISIQTHKILNVR